MNDERQVRVGGVEGLLLDSPGAHTLYVLAHGAGADMRHRFMQQMAEALARAGVATLRYQFPYTQAGQRRPDPPAVLEATVRAAIEQGRELASGRVLIAGGKSMGGRMTSQLLAKDQNTGAQGVAFLGFPLHQTGKPGRERAAHLRQVTVPMLFLQGTRDALAQIDLMRAVCAELGARARLYIIEDADHSFAVPKRTGRTQAEVIKELAETITGWARQLAEGGP